MARPVGINPPISPFLTTLNLTILFFIFNQLIKSLSYGTFNENSLKLP